MKVSFIIPAYNEEDRILDCIYSIWDSIAHYNNYYVTSCVYHVTQFDRWDILEEYEIIVVNNNSNDSTVEKVNDIIEQYGLKKLKLVHEERKGVTFARQKGSEEASYEIHAYIDADTQIPRSWIPMLNQFQDERVVAISGPYEYDSASKIFKAFAKFFYRFGSLASVFVGPILQGGNFAIRKSILEELGGHPLDVDFYGEDVLLGKRAARYGKVLFLPDMVSFSSDRRFRNQGVLNTGFKYLVNYLSVSILGKPIQFKYKDFRN